MPRTQVIQADDEESREVTIRLPKKLRFLMEMHPYKILYGGRGGMKTQSISRALISLATNQKLRILCAREIQKSIADSVHATLKGLISDLGLSGMFIITENKIFCPTTGSEFIFHGLHGHSVESVKSMAKLDIVWVEEAQTVEKQSWDILLPTVREENAEIWVSFNPGMDTDDTWTRFIVHPPEGAVVVKINWSDNKWFPKILEAQRQHTLKHYPDDYKNIWDGECRSVVSGAIYAREINDMVESGRIRPTPYDPRLPVDTIWDLGWNDAMTIIMVQKPHPSAINIINYREDSGRRYDELIGELEKLRYRWGYDWLPHDATQHHPTSGTNAKKTLEGLGRKVKLIPRTDPEARIRAARTMFPSCYIDDTTRKVETGYLGAARLVYCLRRYRRNIPTTTGEASTPVHDQHSHAADSWGGLSEIVAQIKSEFETPPPLLPGYSNAEPSMGMLG